MKRRPSNIATFEPHFFVILGAARTVVEKGLPFQLNFPQYSQAVSFLSKWGQFLTAAEGEGARLRKADAVDPSAIAAHDTSFARQCKWQLWSGLEPIKGRIKSASNHPGIITLKLVARANSPLANSLFEQALSQSEQQP